MSYFVRRNTIDPIHDYASDPPIATPQPTQQTPSTGPLDPSLRALSRATALGGRPKDYSRVWQEFFTLWR